MSSSARKLARRSDRAPTRMPLVHSFTAIAAMAGVHRSTIGRAFAPGGRLHPALVSPERGDIAHPAVVAYLAEHTGHRPVQVERPRLITFERAARQKGCSVAEVRKAFAGRGPLAAAVVPNHHLSARDYAEVTGTVFESVLEATRGTLAPAVTEAGFIDLGHEASIAYLAALPYPRLPDGDLDLNHVPQGMLAPAMVGDRIDPRSPFAQAFLARCLGRIPTKADEAELAAGGAA
jgi:hypothetical protein